MALRLPSAGNSESLSEGHLPASPADASTDVSRAGEWVRAWGERFAPALLPLVLLCFLLQRLQVSAVKSLWFDEMFTWNLAQQPSWHQFRMGLAVDGNPPLLSGLDRLISYVSSSPLAVRMVPLLACMGAGVLLYRFVYRRLGMWPALAAAVLFFGNGQIAYYAVEARPYGLVLFFAALALVGWQMATDAVQPRRWAKWLLALAFAGAILSHHLALFGVGLPILCGEVARSLRRRRLDWPLAGAALCGLLPVVFTLPLIRATQHVLLKFTKAPTRISMHQLKFDYKLLLDLPFRIVPLVLFGLAVAMWLFSLWRSRRASFETRFGWPVHEAAAVVGSVAALGLVFFVCTLSNGYYAGVRYGIASIFGVACLYVSGVWQANGQGRALLVLLLLWNFARVTPRHLDHERGTFPEQACLGAMPGQRVVLARALSYPTAWHYSSDEQRQRLFFLTDLAYARNEDYSVPEIALLEQKPIFPMELRDYHQFVGEHSEFLLLASGIEDQDYVVGHLRKDGASLTPISLPACQAFQVYGVRMRSEESRSVD